MSVAEAYISERNSADARESPLRVPSFLPLQTVRGLPNGKASAALNDEDLSRCNMGVRRKRHGEALTEPLRRRAEQLDARRCGNKCAGYSSSFNPALAHQPRLIPWPRQQRVKHDPWVSAVRLRVKPRSCEMT